MKILMLNGSPRPEGNTFLALREMGVEPFAQPYRDYNGGEPTAEQKAFARWVNMKSAFKTCPGEVFQRGTKEVI